MEGTIECVLFKSHSTKPKKVCVHNELCNIQHSNVKVECVDYNFNKNLMDKYKVKLKILYSLDYDDEMFHFIGVKMTDIEKNDYLPKDSEINKKDFWWENMYDRNYSLNCGDVIIIRYNSNGDMDNISPEDYNTLEHLIIAPEILNSDDEDSRDEEDLESTDEDYDPREEEYDEEEDEEEDDDDFIDDEEILELED